MAIGPELKCPPWPHPSLPGSHPQPPSDRCRRPQSEAPRVCHPPTCSPSAECSAPHPPWTCRKDTSSSRGPWVSGRWDTSSPWLHLHPPHASRHSQGPSSPSASGTSWTKACHAPWSASSGCSIPKPFPPQHGSRACHGRCRTAGLLLVLKVHQAGRRHSEKHVEMVQESRSGGRNHHLQAPLRPALVHLFVVRPHPLETLPHWACGYAPWGPRDGPWLSPCPHPPGSKRRTAPCLSSPGLAKSSPPSQSQWGERGRQSSSHRRTSCQSPCVLPHPQGPQPR